MILSEIGFLKDNNDNKKNIGRLINNNLLIEEILKKRNTVKINEIIRAKKGILAEIRKSHENKNIIKTRLTILKILFFESKLFNPR